MAQKSTPSDRRPQSRRKQATDAPVDHPEEMRASGEIQIGKYINLKGTARVTPAGLICAGIAGVALLMATAAVVRAGRR